MVSLTVVVDIGADVSTFREQLRTIDAQTLAPELFEVVLVGRVSDDDWRYVDAVCAYRTSVRALPDAAVIDAFTAGTGEFVMAVDPAQRLFPGALEHVHRRLGARQEGSSPHVDGLVGRQVSPGLVPVALWRDGVQMSAAVLPGACAVVGRRWKTVVGPTGRLSLPDAVVEVMSGYPLVRCVTGSADAVPATGSLPVATVEWEGPDLRVAVDTSSSAVDDQELLLRLADTSTGLQFLFLPELLESGKTSFRIPVLTAAAGETLPAGLWSITLQQRDDGAPDAGLHHLGGTAGRPALVDGLGVVPCQVVGTLGLDVGCRREALIKVDDPTTGTITESAAGSLLRLDLANLHVHGRPIVTGKIGVGALLIPGSVVADGEGGVHLEAMMTGVSGTEPLTASFGGGAPKPVGLSLNIDGLGQMTLHRTRSKKSPKAPAAKAARAGATKKRTRRRAPRQGVLADVRRAVPTSLEPVVARIRRSRTARRVYRRLTHS